MGIRHVYLRRS